MRTSKLLLIIIGIFVMQSAFADDDYEKYAKATRDSVWAWDKPEFKNYSVPDKHKNESAVILALHEEVYATGNTKIRFTGGGILGFGLNKELTFRHIIRKMIKLNDKKALEDNADLEFKENDKSYGRNVSTLYKAVIGVRIIKPDGTIKEVDMSEAVSVTEGKKDKERNKKLAISDLQVGDILDYFYQEEGRIDYQNIPEQLFVFASKYPILSYSVHCELSKKLTNEYRLLNGAPDFTVSTNEEGDYVLDVKQTNIQKVTAEQWLSPLRQLPIIRLIVLYNSNKNIGKPATARKEGLYANLPSDKILTDALSVYNLSSYYLVAKQIDKQVKKTLKENPETDKKQLAELIAQSLSVRLNNVNGIYYNTYIATLAYLFKRHKIDHKVGFVTSRFDVRGTETSAYYDYDPLIVANNDQVFHPNRYKYYVGNDSRFEGETAEMFVPRSYNTIYISETEKRSKMKLPVSTADQNVNKTSMSVKLAGNNMLTLDIDRQTILTGHQRNGYYSGLILLQDWDAALEHWKGEKSELEKLKEKNKTKDINAFEARYAEDQKEQKKTIEAEIKYYHDMDAKELEAYSFPTLGVTPDQREMVYSVKYTLDGLVKRAGSNYILDAGKLIGTQVKLEDGTRDRTIDVYMSFPRGYEHEIKVAIPAGYKVENIKNLNYSIDNECGQFISSASVEGSDLVIKVKKVYKNNYEPANNWDKLVQMIDAANAFFGQSIVFKK